MKKIISMVLAVAVMVCATSVFAKAEERNNPKEAMQKTISYASDVLFADDEPTYMDEWYIFALARSGDGSVQDLLDAYYSNAEEDFIAREGKYTDYSGADSLGEYVRVALTLTAMDRNISDFGGYDLLDKIIKADSSAYEQSSTSTLSYALKIIEFYEDEIQNANELKSIIIDEIMMRYIDDMGFTYMLGEWAAVDVDTTAQAIQGLAFYYGYSDEVTNALENSFLYLGEQQNSEDGAIMSWGASNPSSTAQVIITASLIGEQAFDYFITDNGDTLIDGLLVFELEDGGYYEPYYGADAGSDYFTTSQVLQALVAYDRMISGKTDLFDFSDLEEEMVLTETNVTTLKPDLIDESPKTNDTSTIGFIVLISMISFVVAFSAGKPNNEK
ncbi:MAG: hypothetical protein GX365_04095 [Clostridiales bacterium]|nr:hypothetical protein [Clostridiales bacterium]